MHGALLYDQRIETGHSPSRCGWIQVLLAPPAFLLPDCEPSRTVQLLEHNSGYFMIYS